MTVIWLIVWALSGCNDPVLFTHMTTNPELNGWATFLVIAVALDLSSGASGIRS